MSFGTDDEATDLEMQQRETALQIQRAKLNAGRPKDAIEGECTDCGEEIAQSRLAALPGCFRCINCQSIFEIKNRK